MNRLLQTLSVALLISALPGCMLLNRTAPPPKAALVAFQPTVAVQQGWSEGVGNGTGKHYLTLTPALNDGRLYASSTDGRVTSLDAATGRVYWRARTGYGLVSGPGVGEGVLVLGTRTGVVLALSSQSGKVLWVANLGTQVLTNPTVTAGRVLVKGQNNAVYALSVSDGSQQWVYKQPVPDMMLRTNSAVVASGSDRVVTGLGAGQLVSLSLNNGQPAWREIIAQPVGSAPIEQMVDVTATPIVTKDRVYATTYQGQLVALNRDTGNAIWQHAMSAYTGLVLHADVLYVTDADGHVWAFKAANGDVLWKQTQLFGRYLTAPVVVNNQLAVGDAEGYLHVMALADGHFVARQRAGNALIAAPIVMAGYVYAYTNSGRLVAYRVG